MKLISNSLRKKLVKIKNNNPYLRLLWLHQLASRKKKSMMKTDEKAVTDLYFPRAQKVLDLENPKAYTEKLQWLKLYYRNDLMPILADKYLVRGYLEKQGLGGFRDVILYPKKPVQQELPLIFPKKVIHHRGRQMVHQKPRVYE